MALPLSAIIVESFLQELTNKERQIENCSGVPGIIYNFSNKNLTTFEDKFKSKGDIQWRYILTLKQVLQPITVLIQNETKCLSWLIVIHEIRQISRNRLTQGPKFCKLQEAIWLTVINEIFNFPPRLGPYCEINYLPQFILDYPSYPIQKRYIWTSFQTSRKKFCKFFRFSP